VIAAILYKADKNIISRKGMENQLRKHRDSLEKEVEERTKKLNESHAQLIQSEKLSSMGKLAGYLAHEINNPIGIIVSRAECILMDAEDEGYPDHILNDIEVIRKHSHRIASITNNMLTFTRKSSVDFTQTDVNRIIDDTLLFMEKRFINNQIVIRKEMDYSIPETYGNANQIQQVLLNIFNNARDAMPDGGEITIRSLYSGREMINVSISDSGHGITEEDREHIFEPFFTTKESGKGTGLGLSVAHGIIKDHKGKISVFSKDGEGTTFEILLPVYK
jgi:signal transduction histidine kinase